MLFFACGRILIAKDEALHSNDEMLLVNPTDFKKQSKVADKSLLFHVSCAIEAIKLLLLLLLSSQFLDSCE